MKTIPLKDGRFVSTEELDSNPDLIDDVDMLAVESRIDKITKIFFMEHVSRLARKYMKDLSNSNNDNLAIDEIVTDDRDRKFIKSMIDKTGERAISKAGNEGLGDFEIHFSNDPNSSLRPATEYDDAD
jgi:hypothetical protein